MMSPTTGVECEERVRADAAPGKWAFERPPFHFFEPWKAPLHDFPIRDEILSQFFPFSSGMDVLEVGPGCGFTAFWLAGRVRRLTLVDVAEEPLEELRKQLQPMSNVRCVQWNLSQPGLANALRERCDAAFGLDVFEYVADPVACLQNLATVLRPNGLLFLSFPNVAPPAGDGVTWFREVGEIEGPLQQAGFGRCEIFSVSLRAGNAFLYRSFHEWPLGLVRRWRKGSPGARPQIYDSTWFFQHRKQLHRYRFALNLYWALLGRTMRLGGHLFVREPAEEAILGRQLVIRAEKQAK